jgi:hypothetical protein
MKKAKIGFWLLILAFLALFGWQNKAFFIQKNVFYLDLWVKGPYESREIYNAIFFAACFFTGAILAFLMGLPERFRHGKTVKQLNSQLDKAQKELSEARGEIETLRRPATVVVPPPEAEEELDDEAQA